LQEFGTEKIVALSMKVMPAGLPAVVTFSRQNTGALFRKGSPKTAITAL